MKKYLSILTALIAVLFTSCSNDDIPVMHETVFKVDPSTVISSYLEYNIGDLTSFSSGNKLRIRLLAYDEDGVLVASDESFSNDYTHIQTFNFALPEGNYTTVAITDVVSSTTEFYTLSNQERLNTTTITSTGKIGLQSGILGLTTETHYVSSYTNDINIKVKPAGALIVYSINNWNACLDYVDKNTGENVNIESYALLANQVSGDLTLNSVGEPVYSITSSTDYDYLWTLHTRNSNAQGGYGYIFKFPMSNVKLKWVGETFNDKVYSWGDAAVVNIEAGKEYYFELNVDTNEAEWLVLDLSSRKSANLFNTNNSNATLNQNFNLMIKDEPVSIKAIDYLKKK